jgi:hypothetical protein
MHVEVQEHRLSTLTIKLSYSYRLEYSVTAAKGTAYAESNLYQTLNLMIMEECLLLGSDSSTSL